MSDYLSVISPNSNLTVADFDGSGPGTSTNLATGDIRRKYNFGSRVSELSIPQDPFFRFASKVAKKPTDDPQFKFTEKRSSFHKRYAYVGAAKDNSAAWVTTSDLGATKAVGDPLSVRMITDYKSQGNIQMVFGNSSSLIYLGSSGTMPEFFMAGQVVRIPTSASAGGAVAGYMLARINQVDRYSIGASWSTSNGDATDVGTAAATNPDMVELTCTVVRIPSTSANSQYLSVTANYDQGDDDLTSSVISSALEPQRCYVVGTAHQEGSGFPETWLDQPYQSNHGVTQIFKTTMAMTNTARATALKFESSEWARVWKEKLIEHKWDIETSLLFGSQYEDSANGINYTQGAVDYITGYGNTFSLTIATKTQDDFLDDMSSYLDPRYNNSQATLFFCSTEVYNWLHKLSGYFQNNLETSPNLRADMSLSGKKKVFGVDISTISTVYGDMNVARNIHLDGTNVKMLGINMKNCAYRPLVGNGINRDTSVYVGVQTLENSGVDRRVDQILTEAGMEWQMPESHAIWT